MHRAAAGTGREVEGFDSSLPVRPTSIYAPAGCYRAGMADVLPARLASLAVDRVSAAERPQGRAAPSPPPVGVKETWGGPAFP
jgi:hypothetical protein